MLKVGSKVACRFYNTPDQAYYGAIWMAEVVEIFDQYQFSTFGTKEKAFRVKDKDGQINILRRKEIKKILS